MEAKVDARNTPFVFDTEQRRGNMPKGAGENCPARFCAQRGKFIALPVQIVRFGYRFAGRYIHLPRIPEELSHHRCNALRTT